MNKLFKVIVIVGLSSSLLLLGCSSNTYGLTSEEYKLVDKYFDADKLAKDLKQLGYSDQEIEKQLRAALAEAKSQKSGNKICGYTDEEWELLSSKGVNDKSIDEMISNASSPGVVCETLDGILYSSGDSDEDLSEEEEYSVDEEKVEEPVDEEKTPQEKIHDESMVSHKVFLTEELPSLLQPLDEAGIEYETEIAIQGAESTGSVYIRVVIENTNYSSWDIKQLIPKSTNEKYINVIYTTIDGERLAYEIY
ncbi:hypothetical protein [Cytobacillus sp. SAFR-174]|uniref:hypothetical protein n=1 Tax=Cytobacillus sp. SAFR-174 TaxID=3436868 RepID=UPI003F7E1FEF